MELGTTGSILSFGLELEAQAIRACNECLSKTLSEDFKSALEQIRKLHQQNEKALQKLRRENVTEMILEPIQGMSGDFFKIDLEVDSLHDNESIRSQIRMIDENAIRFYLLASEKTNFLPDLNDALRQIAGRLQDIERDLAAVSS